MYEWKVAMTRKCIFVFSIFLLCQLLCQLTSCTSIYRSVKAKRDRNYKEGVALFNQSNFAEAKDRFETVVSIEPEFLKAKQYLDSTNRILSMKDKNVKIKANVNYEKGVALLHRGKFEDALTLLLAAKEQDPDHADVDDKIDKCRDKLTPKYEKTIQLAERQFQKKQFIPAYNTYLKARIYNPSGGKTTALRNKLESKMEENAGKYKTKGTQLYNKKKYAEAQKQLNLAANANPYDKGTKELLDKCNGRINLDKNYQSALQNYNSNNLFGAKAMFNQVNAVEPGYKGSNQYLNKINNALQGQIGTFYNNGVAQYDKGNYETAIAEFNKVLSINPSHTGAQEYRQRADTKLQIKKSLGGPTE